MSKINRLADSYGYVKSYRCDGYIIFGLRYKRERENGSSPTQMDEHELHNYKIMDFWFALLENNQLVFYQANGDRLPGGTFDLRSLAGVDMFNDEDIVGIKLNAFILPYEPTMMIQAFQGVVSAYITSVYGSIYQVDFDFTSSLQFGYTIKFKQARLIGRNKAGYKAVPFGSDEWVKLAEASHSTPDIYQKRIAW